MNRGNKEQRVGVFVDVQNMYYSARNIYNAKVNFANILKEAVVGRKLIRAIAYVIKADIGEEQTFFEALKHIGYEVKAKDLQVFIGGAKKGDWDIGIAMDAIELAHKLDVICLVSGDGDYVPLVQHLQRALGCRVEVLAFGKSAAGKLKEAADDFVDFDEQAPRYLIKRTERRTPTRMEPVVPKAI
ncbi:MAG TPA: NYN domain-containing protein [Candidatus Nanoarchaeia archaeon]|nr:NYN domain-containing protein [Candidatus Nanoarchaeia archaeon]